MSWIRNAVGRSLLAAMLVVMSLFAGVAPIAAETTSDDDAGQDAGQEGIDPPEACGIWFFIVVDGGTDAPCDEITDGDLRAIWTHALMGALESFGASNGTYKVPASGFDGGGNGWAVYEGNRYTTSVASRLSTEGFLPPLEVANFWERSTALAASEGIAMVYRCKDRVAVFNAHSSLQASTGDSDWWAENGCNRYPIDRLGATDYVISRKLGDLDGADEREALRVAAVDALLLALESFGATNGTYKVPASGFDGGGKGWGFYEGDRYSTSIANVLIAAGHLEADPLHDPLWAETTSMASAEGVALVYTCKDRVAVFTRHGTAQPSTDEAGWWTDNKCRSYPIDQLGATYYRVSNSLSCACIAGGHWFF